MKPRTRLLGYVDRQCPNCDYYKVEKVRLQHLKREEEPYTGWRWWKDTTTQIKVEREEEIELCAECGWQDNYEQP